jgi:hypothetical protein
MHRGLLLDRPASVEPIPVTAGLVACWDARDVVGVGDGGAVSSWPDSSGNGWAAAQATGSKQPTWHRAGINGMPAVKFDGVDDLLVVANQVSTSTAGTILAVVQRRGAAFTILSSSDEVLTTKLFSFNETSGGIPQIQQRDADTQDLVVGSLVAPIDRPGIVGVTGDGSAWTLRSRGLLDPSLTVSTGADTGQWLGATSARDNVVLGALKRTTEASFASGFFAFVALYSAVLTTAQLQTMERWLGRIWKIAIP